MTFEIESLIWLFPIAFILHDFEELILFEPWLKKNAGAIKDRIKNRIPAFMEKQIDIIINKSTPQFALPICLIFILTCVSSILAAVYGKYFFFLLASSLFFLHGFMHLGQAMIMRRYIPAVITSLFIAIPYGGIVFWRLIVMGIVNIPILLINFLGAIIIAVPFIMLMHIAGEFIYKKVIHLLVG
jgi:hypothetical protein